MEGEYADALKEALQSNPLTVIEARIDPTSTRSSSICIRSFSSARWRGAAGEWAPLRPKRS
jgi:hypothetical protein